MKYRVIIKTEVDNLPSRQDAWRVILEGYAYTRGTPQRGHTHIEANPPRLSLWVTAPQVDAGLWAGLIDDILYEEYGINGDVTVEEDTEEDGVDGLVGSEVLAD